MFLINTQAFARRRQDGLMNRCICADLLMNHWPDEAFWKTLALVGRFSSVLNQQPMAFKGKEKGTLPFSDSCSLPQHLSDVKPQGGSSDLGLFLSVAKGSASVLRFRLLF